MTRTAEQYEESTTPILRSPTLTSFSHSQRALNSPQLQEREQMEERQMLLGAGAVRSAVAKMSRYSAQYLFCNKSKC